MSRKSKTASIAAGALALSGAVQINSYLNGLSERAYDIPYDENYKHGRITEANASLFTESYFSEELTGYAVGWKDPNDIDASLEFFAPQVVVPRYFQYIENTNAEEFYSEEDDARAIRGDFGTVEYTSGKRTARTENRGLRIVVDMDEVADKESWRPLYTGKLLRRLKRNSLRRALALLSAGSVNTAKTWDSSAGKDPDQDVSLEIIASADLSGISPNRVGYGANAWAKRVTSHRAQDNAGGYASAGLTPELLAGFLSVDEVAISRERFSTGGAKTQMLNNLVLMFTAMKGMDREDPSNIKRFVTPCEGGGVTKVYERQISAKLYEIVVEHYELTLITSTLGLRKFTVS